MHGFKKNSDYTWSGDWGVVKSLVPYFMEFKARIALAVVFLLLSKLSNVIIPLVMKHIVDSLDSTQTQMIAIPVLFLLLYGLLRFGTILFGEIRDTIFGRVTERAMRRIGLKVFQHLHSLELEFHLARRTGGLSRDIERGTTGISFLMRFMLFNILPTLLEILLISAILFWNYNAWYALIILIAVSCYVVFSVIVTERRTEFVRAMNAMDSRTNTRAVDSLLNFETVKYFTNEEYEARQYDENLAAWEKTRAQNRLSLLGLNSGQALVIASSIMSIMWLASADVVAGEMTLGDIVMVNAYMMQLFIPLNFLGFVYREIKRALADIEHMFSLLERQPNIADAEDANELDLSKGMIEFKDVRFSYNDERHVLTGLSFMLPAHSKLAIVGPSGAGKSTLARLLFRFYDVSAGSICIDGQDIRTVSQHSLRRAIGVVPQDTVLFNHSIYYNIAYGNPAADREEIYAAAKLADIDTFIQNLPQGYETMVGERGLKVSGGEKQRIAIARMLLKRPAIMVFDEATSSLDSVSEQSILAALNNIATNHTTLIIAHRLSTVVDADNIIVLETGKIAEQGRHQQLLQKGGIYAKMWALQQQENADEKHRDVVYP